MDRRPGLVVVVACVASLVAGCPDGAAPATPPPQTTPAAPVAASGWPTDDEVKATIHKLEESIRASETNKQVWHVKGIKHEFGAIERGQHTVKKQMSASEGQVECYPVRVAFTRITEYETKDPVREANADAGKTAFFYRDSMGGWACKFVSE